MKTNFFTLLRLVIAPVVFTLASIQLKAQVCDNLALAFDGDDDYISLNLNTPGNPFSTNSNSNFTVEAWFSIDPSIPFCAGGGAFRRLFALSAATNPVSRFEVGECNGQLIIYWYATNGDPTIQPLVITPISSGCHHVAVIRNVNAVVVYMDGVPVYSNPIALQNIAGSNGILNTQLFYVGHWASSTLTFGEDWQGEIDEIRLWNVVRTAQEILNTKDCSLSGTSPGLIVNWTLNQPGLIPDGPNPTSTMALDISGNNNHGTLNGFDLSNSNNPTPNTVSNFVCGQCPPPIYQVDFSDLISLFPINLVSICEGDYVHLCATESGNPINLPSGSMVMWESSEGGANFVADPDLTTYLNAQNIQNALCFPVQAGIITANCSSNPLGYVDRKYRARIIKKIGNEICTYTTQDRNLQICCKVTNALLVYAVQPPTPFNGTLCEGPAVVDVSLASTDPWLVPLSPNTSIQWCVDGAHVQGFDNMTSITYTGLATAPNLCFEIKIQNCSCPVYTINFCITVDPQPMCGPIDGMSPATLMPDPFGGIYDYLICPGDDALVGMVNPPDFKNCNPVWQFHYDNSAPGVWFDLGTSNSIQNTNTLPQVTPPNNSASPYIWPLGADCIIYRIECRPFSTPSGCDPCHSNEVKICLKQPPPIPVISSTASQICKGNSATLSIPPVPGAILYTWYCNGAVIGSGPFLTSVNVMNDACYEVSVFDGCFTVTSAKFCLDVCAIIAIITCPVDNPCACDGLPVTLIGCNSYDVCLGTGPLTYTWYADGVIVPGTGPDGCELIHTPDPNGTQYMLMVCNSLNPSCCTTTTLWIKPCI